MLHHRATQGTGKRGKRSVRGETAQVAAEDETINATRLFARSPNHVHIRLGLEEWTDLPGKRSKAWGVLSDLLRADVQFKTGQVYEIDHNGVDVYLLLRLELSATVESFVEELRARIIDPFWLPFIDLERYAWVGDYHAVSVRPGDKLTSQTLEHPARRSKREAAQDRLGRELPQLWHEASSPQAVGIDFLECVCPPPNRAGEVLFDLAYRQPEADDEAWVAAQLNTRLRLSEGGPMFESMGWGWAGSPPNLIFGVPAKYVPEELSSVEIWWATAGRNRVGAVPCHPAIRDL